MMMMLFDEDRNDDGDEQDYDSYVVDVLKMIVMLLMS